MDANVWHLMQKYHSAISLTSMICCLLCFITILLLVGIFIINIGVDMSSELLFQQNMNIMKKEASDKLDKKIPPAIPTVGFA